jgi:hypothetical protein
MVFILQHYPPSFPSLWEAGNNPVSGPEHVESCVSAATFVHLTAWGMVSSQVSTKNLTKTSGNLG